MAVSSGFLDDLSSIDGSADSITALSTYIRMNSAQADEIVKVGGSVKRRRDTLSTLDTLKAFHHAIFMMYINIALKRSGCWFRGTA